jgi:hypothetical protein
MPIFRTLAPHDLRSRDFGRDVDNASPDTQARLFRRYPLLTLGLPTEKRTGSIWAAIFIHLITPKIMLSVVVSISA